MADQSLVSADHPSAKEKRERRSAVEVMESLVIAIDRKPKGSLP